MPVDKFDYYSLLEPFVDGYYKVGEKAKAQNLSNKLIVKYQENLSYYKTLDSYEQSSLVDIITDIERYRGLLQVMDKNGTRPIMSKARTHLTR
jgi:hypothetical protein